MYIYETRNAYNKNALSSNVKVNDNLVCFFFITDCRRVATKGRKNGRIATIGRRQRIGITRQVFHQLSGCVSGNCYRMGNGMAVPEVETERRGLCTSTKILFHPVIVFFILQTNMHMIQRNLLLNSVCNHLCNYFLQTWFEKKLR